MYGDAEYNMNEQDHDDEAAMNAHILGDDLGWDDNFDGPIGDDLPEIELDLDLDDEDEDGPDLLPGEDMDGDFDTGMASAGFGTDEDYGYYGGDEDC